MPDTTPMPPAPELPSSRTLLRSTAIAAGVAVLLLVTVVLPAEYGVDPTGAGEILGLTEMGRIKVALEREAAAADSAEAAALAAAGAGTAVSQPQVAAPVPAPAPDTTASPAQNSHVTEIVLAPNQGKEVKLVMQQGARVQFSWSTDRGTVNYDLHADAPGIRYHGYGKGNGLQSHEGELVAAFDGSHGWFWRNRGSEPLTLTLRTSGAYREVKGM